VNLELLFMKMVLLERSFKLMIDEPVPDGVFTIKLVFDLLTKTLLLVLNNVSPIFKRLFPVKVIGVFSVPFKGDIELMIIGYTVKVGA